MDIKKLYLILFLASLCVTNIAQAYSDIIDSKFETITNTIVSENKYASNVSISEIDDLCLWEMGGRHSFRWEHVLKQHPLCPKDGKVSHVININFEEHYVDDKGQEHNHYLNYYVDFPNNMVYLWFKWHEPGAHDAEWRIFEVSNCSWLKNISVLLYGK